MSAGASHGAGIGGVHGSLSILDIRFDSGEPTLTGDEVLSLARRNRLTAYDATYLELAKRKHLLLATLDQELIVAAPREDVEMLTHL